MRRIMVVDEDYDFAQQFLAYTKWQEIGADIVDVEYNPAIGLEKFYLLKPDILILGDSNFFMKTLDFIESVEHLGENFKIICITSKLLNFDLIAHPRVSFIFNKNDYNESLMLQAISTVIETLDVEDTGQPIFQNIPSDYDERKNKALNEIASGSITFQWKLVDLLSLSIEKGPLYLLVGKPSIDMIYSQSDIAILYNEIKKKLSNYREGEIFITSDGWINIIINEFLHNAKDFSVNVKGFNELIQSLAEIVCIGLKIDFHFFLSDQMEGLEELANWETKLKKFSFVEYFNYDHKILYYKKFEDLIKPIQFNVIEKSMMEIMLGITKNDSAVINRCIEELYITQIKPSYNFKSLHIFREKIKELFDIVSLIYGISDINYYDRSFHLVSVEAEIVYVKNCIRKVSTLSHGKKRELNPVIMQALVYIINHYNLDISEAMVAEEIGISAAYLSRLFKKASGENFNRILNKIRINKAKELLLTSNYKVMDIAVSTGFGNAKYFNKVFKNYTGVTPTQYANETHYNNQLSNFFDNLI